MLMWRAVLIYACLATTGLVQAMVSKQLACLERDWLTLLARTDSDITSLDIAVTDSQSTDLSRILLSVSDFNYRLNQRNSHLIYMDFTSCETLFFLRFPEAMQPDLQAVSIALGYNSQASETLYHVGKINQENRVVVTRIKGQIVEMFAYEAPSFANNSELQGKTTLTVIQPELLLWHHSHGSMLINLNDRIARSIHHSTSNFNSLVTIPAQSRYLNILSWQKRGITQTDLFWLHTFDMTRLAGSTNAMPLKESKMFDIGRKVSKEVVANFEDTTSALCFLDESTQKLNMMLWEFNVASQLNHVEIKALSDGYTQFRGCASVSIEQHWTSSSYKITSLVFTNNSVLALVTIQVNPSSAQKTQLIATSYQLSKQKLYMFANLSASHFSVTSEFIAIRSEFSGGQQTTWGFVLATDQSRMQRKSQLWREQSIQQDTLLTVVQASKDKEANSEFIYSAVMYPEDQNIRRVDSVASLSAQYAYNEEWISELCGAGQDEESNLFGARFEVDYPNLQQFPIKFAQLIDTRQDEMEWFTTCYPTVKVVMQSSVAPFITLQTIDMNSKTALIELHSITQANLYIQRLSLNGLVQRSNVQIIYYLQLPEQTSLSKKYQVGFQNDPPRITDQVGDPIESDIFISIRWAPNKTPTPGVMLEDIDYVNRDILWESSGPVIDLEDGKISFKQLNLSYFCQVEYTKENRVFIKMTRPMTVDQTGMHRISFQLTDDGQPAPATSTYHVTLVIGLYETTLGGRMLPQPDEDGADQEDEPKQILPPVPDVLSSDDWFTRVPYDERQAQIRVHAISTRGEMIVTFTKPVDWPADIIQLIDDKKLVNVTFEPKTYDYEVDQALFNTTELASWKILSASRMELQFKLEFVNPDMIGYSIFENDEVIIEIDFRSLFSENNNNELFGKFIKSVPLQYPTQYSAKSQFDLKQAIDCVTPLFFVMLAFCLIMLSLVKSKDKSSIVWLTLSHLQLVAFLPLMNVPVPAQVTDISKHMSQYLRFDILTTEGRSVMTTISEYIFDFPAVIEVMPLHFEQLGFESHDTFTTIMGLNFLHTTVTLPSLVILLVAGIFRERRRIFKSVFYRLRGFIFNAFYIRFNLETFMMYAIANMLSAQHISFYNWATALQSLTSVIHVVILALFPLATVVFLLINYRRLVLHKSFRATWGEFYSGMINSHEESKRQVTIYFPAAQLARKFLFAFTVVVMRDDWLVQLGAICFTTMIVIQITSQPNMLGPYLNRNLNKLQIFLDIMIIALADFMVAFNGGGFISKDQNVRFSIGQAYTVFLVASIIPPFIAMLFMTLNVIKNNLLLSKFHKIQRQKQMEEQRKKINKRQKILQQKPTILSHVKEDPNGSSSCPQLSSQVVIQQPEDRIAVRLDQELAEIAEEDQTSEEEDQQSSSSSYLSSVTADVESLRDLGQENLSSFVMGMSLLPDQFQEVMKKQRPRSVPAGGRRPLDDILEVSQLFMKTPKRARPSTSMPRLRIQIQVDPLQQPKQALTASKDSLIQSNRKSAFEQRESDLQDDDMSVVMASDRKLLASQRSNAQEPESRFSHLPNAMRQQLMKMADRRAATQNDINVAVSPGLNPYVMGRDNIKHEMNSRSGNVLISDIVQSETGNKQPMKTLEQITGNRQRHGFFFNKKQLERDNRKIEYQVESNRDVPPTDDNESKKSNKCLSEKLNSLEKEETQDPKSFESPRLQFNPDSSRPGMKQNGSKPTALLQQNFMNQSGQQLSSLAPSSRLLPSDRECSELVQQLASKRRLEFGDSIRSVQQLTEEESQNFSPPSNKASNVDALQQLRNKLSHAGLLLDKQGSGVSHTTAATASHGGNRRIMAASQSQTMINHENVTSFQRFKMPLTVKPTLASYKAKLLGINFQSKLAKTNNFVKKPARSGRNDPDISLNKSKGDSPTAVKQATSVIQPDLRQFANNFLAGIKKRNPPPQLPRMPLNNTENQASLDKDSGESKQKNIPELKLEFLDL